MEAPPTESSWLRFHTRKGEIRRRHRSVWSIPLLRKRAPLLKGIVKEGTRVLDVGAGDRGWESKVKAQASGVQYRSCDTDRDTRQDYYSLDEIEETFDLVLLVEVLEHVSFEEGIHLLKRIRGLLAPRGRLLLTTPNTAHPTQYWHDPTHRTAWAYDFLGGVLLELGYVSPDFFRLHHAKWPALQTKRLLGNLFLRWAGLDFAGTLAVIAERGGE